jgi:EpsI family protein
MTSARWRALFAAALMLAFAALTYVGKPTTHLADLIGKPDLELIFPKQFGPWRVAGDMPVILPAPDVQAQLDAIYNQVLTRTYVDAGGQRVMLSVAYGGDQSDGTSAHRPEVCYPAQGFEITFNQKSALTAASGTLAVRQLMSKLGERNEPVTYWVVVGGEVATSGIEQKLAQMRYGLRGVISDGMLVRVSSIDADMARGHTVQAGFIAEMAAAMPPTVRSRVFGELPH